MKNTASRMTVAVLIVLFIVSGCNKNDNTTNPGTPTTTSGSATFTLNGAGFTNQSFTISGFLGGYSTGDKLTGLAGSSATTGDSTMLEMVFPGTSTGTFPFILDSIGIAISRGTGSSTRAFLSGNGGGQIAVTAYGSVGGTIVGTFSGKMYEIKNTGLDSVTVSNGSFSAMRVH